MRRCRELLLLIALSCHAERPEGQNHRLVGRAAPELFATALNQDTSVSLVAMRGRVVIVAFIGTYDDGSSTMLAKLEVLHRKFLRHGSSVEIVGVSTDDEGDLTDIAPRLAELEVTFPVAFDSGLKLVRAWNPKKVPASFVVDKKGMVRFAHIGYHDGEEVLLEREVTELLEQT